MKSHEYITVEQTLRQEGKAEETYKIHLTHHSFVLAISVLRPLSIDQHGPRFEQVLQRFHVTDI